MPNKYNIGEMKLKTVIILGVALLSLLSVSVAQAGTAPIKITLEKIDEMAVPTDILSINLKSFCKSRKKPVTSVLTVIREVDGAKAVAQSKNVCQGTGKDYDPINWNNDDSVLNVGGLTRVFSITHNAGAATNYAPGWNVSFQGAYEGWEAGYTEADAQRFTVSYSLNGKVAQSSTFNVLPTMRETIYRVWSSDFDSYWNVCVNGAYRVYAEGNRLYCLETAEDQASIISRVEG